MKPLILINVCKYLYICLCDIYQINNLSVFVL